MHYKIIMSCQTPVILLKATIWVILILMSIVGESHGYRLHKTRSRLGHRGKFNGDVYALEGGHKRSRVLYVSPESDRTPFTPFTPFTSFTPFTPFSPMRSPSFPKTPSTPPTKPTRPPGLQVGFYKGQCPSTNVDVEATITAKVQEHFRKDATLLPALLRMQFHDCFVHVSD